MSIPLGEDYWPMGMWLVEISQLLAAGWPLQGPLWFSGEITWLLDCNGRGLGGGIPFLFPGHLPPSSLTQWIGHTSAAAPEQAHPNRYKKHKHPSSSGQAHKGRQGTLGGVGGLGPCSPDSVAKEDAQKFILCLRALGISQPFPSPARQHSKAQICGLCLPGLHPGDRSPC